MSAHHILSVLFRLLAHFSLSLSGPPIGSSISPHFDLFGPVISGRQDGPGPPSTLRRRLPGPWPAAWTHGGVELNCELNVSHGFSFVESCYIVNDGPVAHVSKGCATLWTGLVCMYSHETLVHLLSTVSRCECVLAWLPGDPVLSRQHRT